MLSTVTADTLSLIKNPLFIQYARIYLDIYENFLQQVQADGMAIAEYQPQAAKKTLEKLCAKGAIARNNGKSLVLNWLSPACEACKKGTNSLTFYLSLMCHRKCYYCFNPNQENYEFYTKNKKDCRAELEQVYKKGRKLSYLALTGGEPLLHKKETIEFFHFARRRFRKAHTRLYTSGDLLDQETLQELNAAGLNEIRFSIKLEDEAKIRQQIYEQISRAKQYIPDVMVEMPVIPGTLPEMKALLLDLERLEISGINLLEFCYPFYNVQEFQKRAFQIKNPPYETLYNYWYAGGLPVAQSEAACLELLDFALDQGLKIGVHYCSLENKHTGQVFQQNSSATFSALTYFSSQDFFLKTAKVFGEDIAKVLKVFKQKKITSFRINQEHQFLEFHVREIKNLKGLNVEIAISSQIIEAREDGQYLRELKVELTYPESFDLKMI